MELKKYLEDLEYLVNQDSCSDDPEGLNKMAAFFSERFEQMSWNVHAYDLAPQSGTLLVCTNREAAHYDVMLVGHLDTVFPKGTCERWPFRIEGDKAFGPGVGDMKHGCLLMYYLMKELPRELNEKLNIVVVFNPDEEIGSRYSKDWYIPYAQKSDYCYLYEARAASGAYCSQRKGAVQLKVDFTGKAGHCGFVFTNGAKSAVSEMAKWIVELDKLQSRERNTSVNVGVAGGGTKPNVVAEHALITVDIRFTDPAEEDRVMETVAALEKGAAQRGICVQIARMGKKPWVLTPKAEKYLNHVAEIAQAEGMQAEFKSRGGLSDANIIAQYGPVCIDGMGPSGGCGHSEDEYILIDTVQPVYDFSMLLLKDLAENK